MIVVLPDSKTRHNGSMYSSSPTGGDFERFVARDLVAHVDAHYRTLPDRASRGLVGHSMGGYGATRIGRKHADVFGSLYVMSPCCLSPRGAGQPNSDLEKTLDHYGIANSFEIYPGTHTSHVAVRFQQNVLPFFSRSLSFEQTTRR